MMDLEDSWKITRACLEAAYTALPAPIKEDVSVATVKSFREWLTHNELELALDELEGLGQLNEASAAFWRGLLAAAQNMSLQEHAARYQSKLG